MLYTHEKRDDGFGGQYQAIITTYLYCKDNNLEYVYSPFIDVEHNYSNDFNFINKLEYLINLKDNIQNKNENSYVQELLGGNIRPIFENNINKYCNSQNMQFIKDCFWKNKNKNFFNNSKINISIHIRRENQHDNGRAGERVTTPNAYYLSLMNIIRKKHNEQNLLFHIYSQGDVINFKDFENDDVEFHTNEELTTTFIGLVAAEILIISPSSFSYVAGLISDGIVFYKRFWHNPKKEWIVC
jgi:hypothetical protein